VLTVNEIELKFDASTTVTHFDGEGMVPTTATLALYRPDGTLQEAPTVTKPTASTTTTGSTTATTLVLTAGTGFAVGQAIAVASDGVTYACKIARLDGVNAHLETALPLVVDTGSTVKALGMTATVAAPGAAMIGAGYRLVWTYSDATAARQASYQAAVVRWPWSSPVAGQDVRSVLSHTYQERKSEAFCDRVAELANSRIRGAIQRTGRRPWLYLSPLVFTEAARQAIRYALAEEGVYQGGDAIAAQREMRFAFEDAMTQALTAASYDGNNTGTVEESTPKGGGLYAIKAVR
jgi:hypothetical protein